MPVSITATFTPAPVRPSEFCAVSAPIIASDVASSGDGNVPGLGIGMMPTGQIAFTPSMRWILAIWLGVARTESPLNNVSKAKRSVYLAPAFDAAARKAAFSAFTVAFAVPSAVGGLESSTNQKFGVWLMGTPGSALGGGG